MEEKARQAFLKKISVNGFGIEEIGSDLILYPRGARATAEIRVREAEANVWQVVAASGAYSRFSRAPNRVYFESYLATWAAGAVEEVA